ncbi:hypothetical protein ACEWY4_019365 [Coilia grayii]|uniref:C2H2-type domain-containing protein n=1 Tax=Coilia grayii TaxID=363190 RepID=A0ABD1J9Q8_9TELE
MSDQQEEPEGVYVEHQYMCSECQQLFNTLEEVLVHQQSHTGPEEAQQGPSADGGGGPEDGDSHYQCLECGAILRNPEELLLHQEMHMREAGLEPEHELCEVLESAEYVSDPDGSAPIQYQCLECHALFHTPELWMQHRHTHTKSSTHSTHSSTEYVVQADGSVTPLVSVQNLVLDEQRAGEILAQVLAQQQQQAAPPSPSRAPLLAAGPPLPGSATLRLQICSAQALADGSGGPPPLRRARLLPPLLAPSAQPPPLEKGRMHPYECPECSLKLATPEDFLQHQGEHFLCLDKESGGEGVMAAWREEGEGAGETDGASANKAAQGAGSASARQPVGTEGGGALQCAECQRTFTSANRLAAHRRVHELGTHECPECDKVFKKAGSLQTHLRSHSGEARYLCVDCGHGFTTEMTLIIHRKSHTAEPLHRCEFCNKTFTNMTKFLYHRRTHTARTPLTSTVSVPPRRAVHPPNLLQQLRERQGAGLSQAVRQGASPQETGMMAPLSEAELEAESSQEGGAPLADPHGDGAKQNGVSSEAPSAGEETPAQKQQEGESSSAPPSEEKKLPEGSGVQQGAALGFPCPACGKAFPSQLRLLRHRRTVHVAERLFRCAACSKAFKKQVHLRNHLRTHTGERPFQCSDCGKTFSSLANLSRHALTHTGARPYRCHACPRAFSQSSNLRQHQLLHASAPPCPCPECPATFLRPAKLAAHRYALHRGAPPYPCPHCPQGFLRKRLRDLHCLAQHPHATEPTPPPLSDTHASDPSLSDATQGGVVVTTPQGEGLQAQKADAHLGRDSSPSTSSRPSLDCEVCGKRLNSASNLRLHWLSHVGAGAGRGGRGYPCGVCGKQFVSASSLALHGRVHTGERPFPCSVCGKRFRQNTHLREHLRTHSGERPFRCDVCGKGFVQSMHLAEHRRTHTGERPHACHCGKAFKTVSNLRSHQKIHARAQTQAQAQTHTHTQEAAVGGGHEDPGETGTAVALLDGACVELSAAVPALCQEGALGQPQLIQIQTADLAQGTPTIMCNEFGETIAIIETSEGGALPLAQALQIYHTALEGGLGLDTIAVDSLQLL